MKIKIIFFLLLVSFTSKAITLDFAHAFGGNVNEESICIYNDHQGHYYLSGRFSGSVDFDFSAATNTLTSNGSTDIFFAKYDLLGNLLWAKRIGGGLLDGAYSIKTDHNHDVVLCGYFRGSNVDFDPGPSSFLLSSNGDNGFDSGFGGDAFLAKFTSNGNFLWAFAVGGYYSHDGFSDFDVDDSNNIYVGGFINATSTTPVDIDPGAGVVDVANSSQGHGLIAKYSATGNYMWGFTFGDYGIASGVFSLKRIPTDTSIVVTGHIKSTNKDFDPGASTSFITTQFSDIFLTKINFGGSIAWVENFGGTNTNHWQDIGTDISVDSSRCIYLSGFYTGNGANFNPLGTPYIQNAVGDADNFIAKYDRNGKLIWFDNFGSSGTEGFLATERYQGTLFITGSFSNTLDLDPSASTSLVTSNGATDAFIAKFDTSGHYKCGFSIGGSASENVNWITDANSEYTLLTTAYYNSISVDVDPSASNSTILNNGGYDNYYLKYSFDQDTLIQLTLIGDTICANQTPQIFIGTTTSSSSPMNISYTVNGNTYTATNVLPNSLFNLLGVYTSSTTVFINSITPVNSIGCISLTYSFNSPIPIQVAATPSITLTTSPVSLCIGQPATITASGASQYAWNPSIQNGVPFTPTATTTYTVTATGANGCTATTSTTITVNSLPTVTALASPTNVCIGSPTTLTGSGAMNYTWSGGIINGLPFYPSVANNYTVTGTDANGCSATSSVAVSVISLPVITSTAQPDSICAGAQTTLSANGGVSYTWTGGIQNNVPFTLNTSTTFTVTGTDNNGCSATATQPVFVYPSSTITAQAFPDSLCLGNTTTLSASGASIYIWSGGVINNVPFYPTSSGTYTVTGIDAQGCSNTSLTTIHVFSQLPVGIINASPLICAGDSTQLTGVGATNYTWSPSNYLDTTAGPSVWAFPVGGVTVYTVTGTDGSGCSGTATTIIKTTPTIQVTASKENDIICGHKTAQLHAYGADSYVWTPALGLSNSLISDPTAAITKTTTYYVTGTSDACFDSDSVTILFITEQPEYDLVPNAFSPNGDGLNDCVRVLHNVNPTSFYFTIYNRWGQMVFETKNPDECWNGTIQGKQADVDTYYYYLKSSSICGDQFVKGDILLIR